MKTLIHWILSALAVAITTYLLPGISLSGSTSQKIFIALIVAVVLGFFNIIVRPILLIFTLPINVLSLGLFTFVINAALVLLTGILVPGFFVKNFWWALLFSLILSIVNSIIHRVEESSEVAR